MRPLAQFIFAITVLTSYWLSQMVNCTAGTACTPTVFRAGTMALTTVITSGLIHNDWMPCFNMLSFYFFAFRLEPTLRALAILACYTLQV